MKRTVLDDVAREYSLTPPGVALALDLTGARPDAAAWRAFTLQFLNAAGIASLGAGIIFFVAANWQDYGILGRFAILQAAFVGCIAAAGWGAAPPTLGHGAPVVATKQNPPHQPHIGHN
jgi:hypothetical protein